MDISKNKQMKSHTRRSGHGEEKGNLKRETEFFSNSNIKQCHN